MEEFTIFLTDKFQILQPLFEKQTIGTRLKGITQAVTSTLKDMLGPMKNKHKEWMTIETLKILEESKRNKAAVSN